MAAGPTPEQKHLCHKAFHPCYEDGAAAYTAAVLTFHFRVDIFWLAPAGQSVAACKNSLQRLGVQQLRVGQLRDPVTATYHRYTAYHA